MPLVRTHCSILLCWSLAVIGAPVLAKDSDSSAQPAAAGRFTVLELPPPTTGLPEAARQRAHHALSFSTDAPKPFLRSLGLDATDCSVRLRMPSRITPSRGSSTGIAVDVQAQAGLGCRF
jgi:hypothetical protein